MNNTNEVSTVSSNKIIQNKIYMIVGPPWSWKSIVATYMASWHPIIYANYEIKYRWKKCNNSITHVDQLEYITIQDDKTMIVIDEWGVNNNARNSWSEWNMLFWQLAMLWRKKNANIIMVSQLSRMSDVYYRELADCIIEMKSWYVTSDKLMFEMTIERNWIVQGSKIVDLFEWSKEMWYTYNTLESWRIEIRSRNQKKPIDVLFE